jgi:L-ascorbate metabolism protein UlaG (beta-lactamase superfamily)
LRYGRLANRLIACVAALSLAAFTLIARSDALAQSPTPNLDGKPPRLEPARWPKDRLTVANLGHSTLLLNFFGVRVISDPALFDHVGLSLLGLITIGPERFVPSPLSPAELQSVDLILITHAHMDHLDIPSLRALPKSATVVACTKCGDLIAPLGFSDVRELEWGESTEVKGLKITAMGANHWGKRWPPFGETYGFNSYILEKDGHRMLLACDSAFTDIFAAVNDHPPEVAAFSIGAYNPWIWNHADPEQVWQMFTQTGARWLIPIHWGTFRLSKEPMDEPMRRLIEAAGAESDRVVLRTIGNSWTMPEPASNHVTQLGR